MKKQTILQTFLPIILLIFYSCQQQARNPDIADNRPVILKNLDGVWRVNGRVRGDTVNYHLTVRPVLNNTFSELHMVDVSTPPQYEARVYIGYDSASHKVVTHWLDSFGPAYSIPHGTGTIDRNSIEFVIPYQEGPFRDILTYQEQTQTWTFLIESSKDSITWDKFAGYTFYKDKE